MTPTSLKDNTAELQAADKAIKGRAQFVLSVASLSQLPTDDLPEIAFAGRSNVGKSSIINALTAQNGLAKTSNTPGRTQQLNFFKLDGQLYLVDFPGYGFAKAPENMVKKWQQMIFTYLQGRANLKRVFLLIDSRHGLKKVDTEIMELLDKAAVTYQIVLTKIDKISSAALAAVQDEITKVISTHAAAYTQILVTSSEKNLGLSELRAQIASFM
ncbi:MAG: YihA family ribosome biogenesis GTP-binding protein [Alphaproteobacteria bacterium]|nr:YihA family ribosome biogenesis GTP-binding protein [Alphaproteobacteria bacterium]